MVKRVLLAFTFVAALAFAGIGVSGTARAHQEDCKVRN